jgi:DNA polymerase-1
MIRIHDELRARRSRARMLLQVHDELVLEVPEDSVEETRTLVRELMESAFQLTVPLEVATGVGANWWECK